MPDGIAIGGSVHPPRFIGGVFIDEIAARARSTLPTRDIRDIAMVRVAPPAGAAQHDRGDFVARCGARFRYAPCAPFRRPHRPLARALVPVARLVPMIGHANCRAGSARRTSPSTVFPGRRALNSTRSRSRLRQRRRPTYSSAKRASWGPRPPGGPVHEQRPTLSRPCRAGGSGSSARSGQGRGLAQGGVDIFGWRGHVGRPGSSVMGCAQCLRPRAPWCFDPVDLGKSAGVQHLDEPRRHLRTGTGPS